MCRCSFDQAQQIVGTTNAVFASALPSPPAAPRGGARETRREARSRRLGARSRRAWPRKNAGLVSGSLAMDDLIVSTGVSFRALALPGFMDNILRNIESIRQLGTFSWPILPTLKLPHCATLDIAAVASKLLLDRSWSGRDDLPILGPEDLSFDELAQIVSDVLQRPVRYQQISIAAFKSNLLQHGASEAIAQGMIDMFDAKNQGLDNGVRRSAETNSPTSFRAFCEQVLKPLALA